MMFENYHVQCLKILIFFFHGVLLDPIIENSCGPLINCNFCSTFDETTPFITSPSSTIFYGEYQPSHQTQHLNSLATFEWKG
jgi:hypothetical protein